LIQIAEADGRVVGAQPSHAVDLLLEGALVKGLLLLDVMTHPDYRRRGIFAGVVEGLRERAVAHGYRLLLTTPNRDAERGFARLPAWTRMGELVPWVRIGDAVTLTAAGNRGEAALRRIASYWRRLAPRRNTEPRDSTTTRYPGDDFMAALWRSIAGASPCQVVRDARFVSWRFSEPKYSFISAGTSENPEALLLVGNARFFGRDVLTLVDIMVPSIFSGSGSHLLRIVAERATREHRAAVVGWFAAGSASESVLRAAGYLRVPKMLRPRPYAVWGTSDLPNEVRRRVLDLNAWSMSLADSDLA
jgi:hypothetical protein